MGFDSSLPGTPGAPKSVVALPLHSLVDVEHRSPAGNVILASLGPPRNASHMRLKRPARRAHLFRNGTNLASRRHSRTCACRRPPGRPESWSSPRWARGLFSVVRSSQRTRARPIRSLRGPRSRSTDRRLDRRPPGPGWNVPLFSAVSWAALSPLSWAAVSFDLKGPARAMRRMPRVDVERRSRTGEDGGADDPAEDHRSDHHGSEYEAAGLGHAPILWSQAHNVLGIGCEFCPALDA